MNSVPELFCGIYKDRRVLITGHTGFKGSYLALWLHMLGAKVCGLSLPPPTYPSLFEILKLGERLERSECCDIRNFSEVERIVESFRPELILHLAAQPLVRLSYVKPLETYAINVQGTLNVLEASRRCGSVRAVVAITTDKCYENTETLRPYEEGDSLGGYDMYSSSKGCAEIICASYRRSFLNLTEKNTHIYSLATARAGNVIGGGDWAEDRLIPDCARALSLGKGIVLRNPQAIRPWQHVLEPLSGYLTLGAELLKHSLKVSDSDFLRPDSFAFNFGPKAEEVLTVKEMAELFVKEWGSGEVLIGPSASLHEAGLLTLDIHKAERILNWRPTWGAVRAVRESAAWYRRFYAHDRELLKFTEEQIATFSKEFENKA